MQNSLAIISERLGWEQNEISIKFELSWEILRELTTWAISKPWGSTKNVHHFADDILKYIFSSMKIMRFLFKLNIKGSTDNIRHWGQTLSLSGHDSTIVLLPGFDIKAMYQDSCTFMTCPIWSNYGIRYGCMYASCTTRPQLILHCQYSKPRMRCCHYLPPGSLYASGTSESTSSATFLLSR